MRRTVAPRDRPRVLVWPRRPGWLVVNHRCPARQAGCSDSFDRISPPGHSSPGKDTNIVIYLSGPHPEGLYYVDAFVRSFQGCNQQPNGLRYENGEAGLRARRSTRTRPLAVRPFRAAIVPPTPSVAFAIAGPSPVPAAVRVGPVGAKRSNTRSGGLREARPRSRTVTGTGEPGGASIHRCPRRSELAALSTRFSNTASGDRQSAPWMGRRVMQVHRTPRSAAVISAR